MATIKNLKRGAHRRHTLQITFAKFLDLPLEVSTEILMLLEWDDVLRTCHRLQEVSMARPVWLALVKFYIASREPRLLWPEKPLVMHAARELERLVLCWQSGKAGWAMNELEKVIPNQRSFFLSHSSYRCTLLVPGGRWLLVGTQYGSVQYYDLDAPTIIASTLVHTPFNEDMNVEIQISIDIQTDAEYLTFHLGIFTRCCKDPRPRWIQVWRVTPALNDGGQVRGLTTKQLASFREEYKGHCDSFSLRGHYVAYALFTHSETGPFNKGSRVIIVDWTACNSASLDYTRKIISVDASRLALLPCDKLVCYNADGFFLYDIADASTTNLPPSKYQPHLSKFPCADLLYIASLATSQPYLAHDSIRISILTLSGVKGVIIPLSPSRHLRLECIDLSGHFIGRIPGRYVQLGYDCAVSLLDWPIVTILRLRYAWPEQTATSVVSRRTITKETGYTPSVRFDESPGRLVVSGDIYEKQRVLDLALSRSRRSWYTIGEFNFP